MFCALSSDHQVWGVMGILSGESMSRKVGVKEVSFQTFEVKYQSIYTYVFT